MATAEPSQNRIYLYRLLTLEVDYGYKVARKIFDEAISNVPLHIFLAGKRPQIDKLKKTNTIQKNQYDVLFPKTGNHPTTDDLDLTLLVCLLRELDLLGRNLKSTWCAQLQEKDTSILADIRRLKNCRNDLAHMRSTKEIDEKKFKQIWQAVESVIIRLNGTLHTPVLNLQDNIDNCKKMALDPKTLYQIEKRIDDYLSLLGKLDELEQKTDELKETTDRHDRRIGVLEQVHLESSPKQKAEDKYQQTKEQLKEDLAVFHRKKHSTIPLSPLFEGNDTPLFDFYLMPGINEVKMVDKKEKKIAIELSQMFKSESEYSREIYISADAGFGKTAFSKYLTVLWRQAHFPDKKHTEHLGVNVNVMRDFEFIFLMLLRDASDDCSIDDLIYNQIVQNLSHSESYSKIFLQEILNREKCLVVLDGLDEWTHPIPKCPKEPKCIPHRNVRENCKILTTTRPWKLSKIKDLSKTHNKRIELTNLNSNSVLELTTRALKKHDSIKNVEGIRSVRERKTEAEKLRNSYRDFEQVYVPLLLMYIICLWCDGKPVVKTKCELYIRIIELLLSRTLKKYEGLLETERPKYISNIQKYTCTIPQCFNGTEHCYKYFTFLISLGELAYERLFNETGENRLVFESYIAEKYLNEDFLKLGRHTGIITQDRHSNLASEKLKTSFSHKTVQEFFAALYISTCPDQKRVVTEVSLFCNSIQDILELSKMFIFISGIKAELFSSLSHELMKTINNDEITRRYRSTHWARFHEQPLKEIQNMFVSCIRESPDKEDVSFCLQDFLFDNFEEQENYYRSLQCLALQNKTNITSILIENGVDNVSKIIDDCNFSDPDIHCEVIKCCCRCEEEDLFCLLSTSVKSLFIQDESSLTDWSSTDDERKYGRSSLTDWRSHLTGEQCKTFHNASSLEEIYIYKVMSHEFLNYIINVKSIKEIILFEVSCSDHAESCPGFNFDLSQHLELRHLEVESNVTLCDMNLDERKDARSCLTDEQRKTFHNYSQLESIRLDGATMSHEMLGHILTNKSLKKIELRASPCSDHGGLCPLFSFDLSKHPELRELVLDVDSTLLDMNEDETVLRNIECVVLKSRVKMSCSCFRRLVEIIEKLEHSVKVYMWECNITPEEEFNSIKDYICSRSESFVVKHDGRFRSFDFVTKK